MSTELRLATGTVVVDDETLDLLADQLVDRVASRIAARTSAPANSRWIRGADAAAEYLGCPRSRIYDLVQLQEVEYRKDGRALVFRREWLDAVLDGSRS